MRVVVRTYSGAGAKELFDILEANVSEVESSMRGIKGFVSYTLARCDDGGFSVTVAQDQAGIDESYQAAKEWIANNAPDTGATAPQVSEGDAILHLK